MVELILVAAILAVGLLGLAALQGATARAGAAAAARQTAACLADGILESCAAEGRRAYLDRCRRGPPGPARSDPGPGPRVERYDREGRPAGAGPAFFTATVDRTAPEAACRVRVQVDWAERQAAAPGRLVRTRLLLF